MSFKRYPSIFIVIVFSILSISCSNSDSPILISNETNPGISQELPVSSLSGNSNRSLLAVYDAVIDPINKTFTVTPDNRTAQYHYPLTQLFPDVLQIVAFGWTPNFWADIKLSHPLPGSGMTGYDPRVIAILPARDGVSFNYPILDVFANNSVILEPDGYTRLYDELDLSIIGNVNPFKAYFKNQPNRVWAGTGVNKETQRWNMDLSGFGGPLNYKFVVDVSANYPNPPQPVIDNAPEPVSIDVVIDDGLTSSGGGASINATLLDWQGHESIGGVVVEAPDLFNGLVSLSFSGTGPNPNEYVYTGIIANSLLAPVGEYSIVVASWDQVTHNSLYNEFNVSVSIDTVEDKLVWAKSAGGIYSDIGYGITTLSDNSTVVTGMFQASSIFGSGEVNQTILTSDGLEEIFVAKYYPDGSLAWAKRAGGVYYDGGIDITSLSDDSTVVTGYFADFDIGGIATFGPGEANETVLVSAGSNDSFIAKYNPDGTLAWAKSDGGPGVDYGCGITTLSDDSIVVTGLFLDSAIFGKGETNETALTSAGVGDIFIAQYNPDGTLAWAQCAGGSAYDYGLEITSLSDNSTVVTGYLHNTATFGKGELNETVLTNRGLKDIFIARYNTDGTLAWAKHAGGPGGDSGFGITALSDDSTVITGHFSASAVFGFGEINKTILTSTGGGDIFIARYNPDGTLAWVKDAGGNNDELGAGISVLSDNSVVVTGYFQSSAVFGRGEINQTILTSAGGYDIFTAQYNPDGTFEWCKRAGGSLDDLGIKVTTLSDNSTVITGSYGWSAVFGAGEINQTTLDATGYNDIFIARFQQ